MRRRIEGHSEPRAKRSAGHRAVTRRAKRGRPRVVYSTTARPTADEYIEFLQTSDLGSLYPRKQFRQRIEKLVHNASVCITARESGRLVGACLGVTDFVYFLFITDIGVARGYERRGIGRGLLLRAQRAAGRAGDITTVTWSNAAALPFYAACKLVPQHGLVAREAASWKLFDVRELVKMTRGKVARRGASR